MRKVNLLSNATLTLVLSLGLGMSAPALAEGGLSGGSSGGEVENTTSTNVTSTSSATNVTEHATTQASGGHGKREVAVDAQSRQRVTVESNQQEQERAEATGKNSELHNRGQQILAQLEQKHKGTDKTAAQKQKTCEAHKQGLTTKFTRIVTNDQRQQTKVTDILTKAENYQQAQNVQAANFDSLVAAAKSAQATSAASITNLQSVTPSLDCNSTSVASDVATFKAAAQQARQDLQSYRSALKAVLQSLEQASTSSTSTTGATNTTTNTSEGSNQ